MKQTSSLFCIALVLISFFFHGLQNNVLTPFFFLFFFVERHLREIEFIAEICKDDMQRWKVYMEKNKSQSPVLSYKEEFIMYELWCWER